jgi:hypothetical protein
LLYGGGEGKKDDIGGIRGDIVGNNFKEPLLPDQASHFSEPRVSFNTRVNELTSDGECGWKNLKDQGGGSSHSYRSLLSPYPFLRKSSTFSNLRYIYIS